MKFLYLWIIDCKCFILNNDKNKLGKYDDKNDEGIFIGYPSSSKVYWVVNNRTLVVEEMFI